MTASTLETAITWTSFVFTSITIYFCYYWLFKYIYMSRNETHIKIRLPTLTYIYVFAATLMGFGRILLEPHNCPFSYCELKDDGSYTQQTTVHLLNSILFAIRLTLMGTALLMKLWYLHYTLKLQTLLINAKWLAQINDDLSKNWWIKNANKYGKTNRRIWILLCVTMTVSILFCVIIGVFVNADIPRYIGVVECLVIALALIIFYCKIPPIRDIYAITAEIKIATATLVTAMLWYPITEFASNGDERIFALSIFNGNLAWILIGLTVYGSTVYPHKLYYQYKYVKNDQITRVSSGSNWTLEICRNIQILNTFMRFLCRCFCVENMLFLIETMQFKQAIIDNMKDCIERDYGVLFKFCNEKDMDKVPKSTIVYNENGLSVHDQIRKIYDKYIVQDALLQINISYTSRDNLDTNILSQTFAENEDTQSLIKIFDEAIIEIHHLLTSLFIRFDDSNYNDIDSDRSDINQQITIALQNQTTGGKIQK
eukprot:309939_1